MLKRKILVKLLQINYHHYCLNYKQIHINKTISYLNMNIQLFNKYKLINNKKIKTFNKITTLHI